MAVTAREGHFLRYYLPYCIEKLDKPGHVWLPINRDYKPLGMTRHVGWIDYQQQAHLAIQFMRDPTTFAGVWGGDIWPNQRCYLYKDGTPFEEIMERFQRLLTHSHKMHGMEFAFSDRLAVA